MSTLWHHGHPRIFNTDQGAQYTGEAFTSMLNKEVSASIWAARVGAPITFKRLQKKECKSNAGRKPFDPIRMFKILVVQSLYNLSDEQAEYQIKDRLSFMRFLELDLEVGVLDATTIWLFREMLIEHGVIEPLFERFNRYLDG